MNTQGVAQPILIYSKYSQRSKKLTEFMMQSNIDFEKAVSLQSLCIDNEHIRKRVLANKQIMIEEVPTVLIIYQDGGIEKYEGGHAFEWFEQIVSQFRPPQHPQKIYQDDNKEEQGDDDEIISSESNIRKGEHLQRALHSRRSKEVSREELLRQEQEENRRKFEERKDNGNKQTITASKPTSRKRVKKPIPQEEDMSEDVEPISSSSITSIEDLDDEEEKSGDDSNARFSGQKQSSRIREDSGNYSEDPSLFAGDQVDMRKSKKSAIKNPNNKESQKHQDIMSKAKELAKGRDDPPPRGAR